MRKTDNLLKEQSRRKSKQLDINKLYIYWTDFANNIQYAFEYSGLRRWLSDFVKAVNNDRLSLTCNSDSSLLIPSGTWVQGIRTVGSATGITLSFNGRNYSISSAANGDEIIPQKHYVATDIYLTVTATSWGSLTITIY
jgi:hypothetical protein